MTEVDVDLHTLQQSVTYALEALRDQATIIEAEVCATWCERCTVRIQYDAEHPNQGVRTPHVQTTFGLGMLLVIEDQDGRRVGFGSESGDLSLEGIARAFEQAKAHAVPDPYFHGLPVPLMAPTMPPTFHDPQVLALHEDEMTRLAVEALDGALSTFKTAGYVQGMRVSGAIHSRTEHMVVGNTHGLLAAEISTGLLANMTSYLTQEQCHGTGSSSATHLHGFAPYDAGAEATQHALRARGAVTLAAGDYPVVFSPQAVADLMQDLLIPALSLDTVAAGTSPFAHRLGQPISAPLLTVTDDARCPGLLGSHGITGEGLPTGATPLIEQGRLVGFLTDVYHAQKLTAQVGALSPRNGMRFSTRGESFGMRPGIFPTNVHLIGTHTVPLAELLTPIQDGIYVGGLWYTTLQGGLQTGNFTSTVIGPSFRIRHGTLAEPLRPETLHVHDNVLELLHRITGLSSTSRAIPFVTLQSLVLAPDIWCSQARFVT
jgi:predicted Zn-dependent protease